jgi:hypothetical protein
LKSIYEGRYRDRFGEAPLTIRNDGRELRASVRGVEFRGRDFDGLSPAEGTPEEKLASFILHHGDLCACTIECDIPVPVVFAGEAREGTLHVSLELGEPRADGRLDRETLRLSLLVGGGLFEGSGRSGWFEDELLEIQAALPEGAYVKACINCAFSDYSPYGHGLFGWLACFRDNKDEYLSVRSKADLFRVWDTLTELVQETYLCAEFRRRRPGSGYRG